MERLQPCTEVEPRQFCAACRRPIRGQHPEQCPSAHADDSSNVSTPNFNSEKRQCRSRSARRAGAACKGCCRFSCFWLTSGSLSSLPPRRLRRSISSWPLLMAAAVVLTLLHAASPALATPMFYAKIKPKWVNPCGIPVRAMRRTFQHRSHYDITPLTESQLFDNVKVAALNALTHSAIFKEDYVKKTFGTPAMLAHWQDQEFEWVRALQQIPKSLHEPTDVDHLKELEVTSVLRQMYIYLQKIAVGLEQVVFDQGIYRGQYLDDFNEAEYKLKAVLCELQMAMMEMGIAHPEDVARDIMSPHLKDIKDQSYRDLRDWFIYRDYMNGLEYVAHAFDHFKSRPPPALPAARRGRRLR